VCGQIPTHRGSQARRAAPGPVNLLLLQRAAGNRAVTAALSARSLQRAITTLGGDWEAEKYDPVDTKDTEGVDIRLTFTPNASVDATRIGMTQIIRVLQNGKTTQIGNDKQKALQEHRQTADGWAVDRLGDPNAISSTYVEPGNPIYGSDAVPDATGKTVADTTFDDQKPGFSQQYQRGRPDREQAVLTDTPQLSKPVGSDTRQEFETTALCIEGTQRDTYYGSVRWGWQTDDQGRYGKLPLERVSFGTPTAAFSAAATKWNASAFRAARGFTGKWAVWTGDPKSRNVPLPLPTGSGILPLPGKTAFKQAKKNAKKKHTYRSKQMPVKKYGELADAYNGHVGRSEWKKAAATLDDLWAGLDRMDQAGGDYWESPELKAVHFHPIVRSAAAHRDFIQAQKASSPAGQ
jgi:hypothetical protein